MMLPLDDPRWRDLNHRGWINGRPYELDPDAPSVPDELEKLLEDPGDQSRFSDLWPYLCSEGTTWPAAYATVPYVVELARRLPPDKRFEHLCFIGLVIISSDPGLGGGDIPPYLVEDYVQALKNALPILSETLVCQHSANETRYLLAAAAALKGYPKLGSVLEGLDAISGQCPNCGEEVYPEELQAALR